MAIGLSRLFRRRQAAWWTLGAGLAVTAVLGWELHREAVALDRQRLALRVTEIQSQLDARLEKSEMLLQHLRDYLMLSGESRNPVFARWCYESGLTINCPWILGIAVATNRHEVEVRATLPKPSATWAEADWEALCATMYQQPIECHLALRSSVTNGQQFLPDYDLRCSFADRDSTKPHSKKAWLAGAIFGSRLSMGERQSVMLDANRKEIIGTVFYVPVYRPELAEYVAAEVPQTHYHRCARWLHLSSVIVAPVDFKRLTASVWDGAPADLGVEIFSSATHLTAETWLNGSAGSPRAADPSFKPYLTHHQSWPMYGQKFSIFFHSTPLFEAQSPRRLATMSMAAGTTLTLLATALVGVALRARNRQEHLAEQIREARDALAAAQQERNRISRDLHDGTIQSLYAIQLGLGQTVEELEARPARAGSELTAVRRELDAVIAEIRQFITAEVGTGQPVDFGAVLQALVQRACNGTTAEIALHCDPGASSRLTGDQAVQLANIAREALSNSLRHAKPRRVQIALRSERKSVMLVITDDGAGFDPAVPGKTPHDFAGRAGTHSHPAGVPDSTSAGAAARPPSPLETPLPTTAIPRGVGLDSMLVRAQEMGGTFEIESSPGQGTCVRVRVPASSADES